METIVGNPIDANCIINIEGDNFIALPFGVW